MLFFFILLWIMSLILNILEIGNLDKAGSHMPNERKKLLQTMEYPGVEFKHIPKFLRQWFTTVRIALGDFDFGESTQLEPFENVLFWLTWVILVTMTCIVFLNFIIAEVSASYASVKERV
jgi:hypothetical protein